MNKKPIRILLLVSVLASLLLTAAVPAPASVSTAAVKEQSNSLRLTIDNRNTKAIIVRLSGPAYYWLNVAGYDSGVFAVTRGKYTMTLTACGVTATTTLDLTSQKKLIMPICGGNAKAAARSSKVIDLSTIIKIIGISIQNKATTDMLVIFTGPSTYVFSVKKGDTMDYTVRQGSYAVTYYACGTYGKRNTEFYANWDKILKLSCP